MSWLPALVLSSSSYSRGLRVVFAFLLALFPVLLLLKQSKANGVFTVLLVWGVICGVAYAHYRRAEWTYLWRASWPVIMALAAYPLVLVLTQLALGDSDINLPYKYLRFALFLFILVGFFRIGWRRLEWLQWGMVAAVLCAFLWIVSLPLSERPVHLGNYNVIPFSNLVLLMGVISALSIGWGPPQRKWMQAVKGLTLCCALVVSYLSQTRGGWLALPAIALLALLCHQKLRMRVKVGVLVILMLAASLVGAHSERISGRLEEMVQDIQDYRDGARDSSGGTRLQLWSSAGHIVLDHPWTGIGYKNYESALRRQGVEGLITPQAASMPHAHNDLLYAAALAGVPGFIALLLIYLVPAAFFLTYLKTPDPRMRCAAQMGLMVPVSFFMFGLTESMFDISMTNAFYIVLLAFFSAYLLSRQQCVGLSTQAA